MRFLLIILIFVSCVTKAPQKPIVTNPDYDIVLVLSSSPAQYKLRNGMVVTAKEHAQLLSKPPVKDTVKIEPPPQKLNWPDRRPIGMVMCANEGSTASKNYMTFDFQAHANRCIKYMTEINAQGCILWDGEGQQFPHPYTYLGDPRLIPDELDAFFTTITAAGFRTGVCLRPDIIVWQGGWPLHFVPESHLQLLIDKISYAHKRWGCTLFYIDSNVGEGMPAGTDNTIGAGDPVGAGVYLALTKLYPNFLFIPEQYHPSYLHVVAPLNNHNGPHVLNGVQVLNVADTKWNEWQVFESVKAGNILMGRVWWPAPELELIKLAYKP